MKKPRDWGRWKNFRNSFLGYTDDDALAPCKVCGCPYPVGLRAPKRVLADVRCDACWEVELRLADYREVELRLADYLRDGNASARAFVFDALVAHDQNRQALKNFNFVRNYSADPEALKRELSKSSGTQRRSRHRAKVRS